MMSVDDPLTVTCTAPVNIALIKYWGKREEDKILPLNPSLSITLDVADLRTKTTVVASKQFDRDRLWLNGKEHDINNKRMQTCIRKLRQGADDLWRDGKLMIAKEEWKNYRLHIISENNFPTAAGLASSASGLACFVYSIAQLLQFKETFPGELTTIARQGSGSACRSLLGGFVLWESGTALDGSDSIARQIATGDKWKSLRVIILIVNEQQKKTSSTAGMQTSVQTSDLLKFRAKEVVSMQLSRMRDAIEKADFPTLATVTMQESNQFHACCLDTFPPIFYLNEVSKEIIQFVHDYNADNNDITVAYTFDAGPNAVLLTREENLEKLMNSLHQKFGFFPVTREGVTRSVFENSQSDRIIRSIVTKIGEGPRVITRSIDHEESLATKEGKPKFIC
ncbi:diphosphomevalonate decarboxylase isoform 1 [Galdieria sulphuraria]|uniref:Diphosphomevalonate decarboxylase n=1 Tax=Galdieria sulphuraria TaxID=130081 RepID=M2W6T4_GALSU|nr:diphosphomevalonate decarboxylase isoform 1 [Galdieria sulphuraria]EME31511.1 diphosphomevalonate decarboxylase isoform 1 [Galdieria sulphuraria]|eukprot:XP_005708031.1 diphosphomevalonate decarboxylase isoform 1 [Galdieria sulphuraria]